MNYCYVADKTIEYEDVRFYFSKNAWDTMQRECKQYNQEIGFYTYLDYCNNFEVI